MARKPTLNHEIELWPIENIHPYEKNAKIHSQTQVESLAQVIQTQGWDVPIVVDRHGSIIKGHGRRLAAMHLGLKEVPVIVRRDMTDEQVKAARLSDNRVALGDFDVELIKEELAGLKDSGFELNGMGFDDKEITMMLGDLDAMNTDVFQPEERSAAPTPAPSEDQPKVDDKPKKPLALTEVLGFKFMPAEFKDALIEFQARAEQATGEVGAEAFGRLVKQLVDQLGAAA